MFIREKRITCNNYIEIDIIPRPHEVRSRGKRSKKKRISRPEQQNLNAKNARRYLLQLTQGNFTEEDIFFTATYKEKYLPSTVEEASKNIDNFFKRVRYHRKKRGLPPLKYISIIEQRAGGRLHHHIIINGGLDRDFIESLWSVGRGKNKESLGIVNTKRLQTDANGLEALGTYLAKDPKGRKRWTSSQNLVRPEIVKNDWKYSKKKVREVGLSNDGGAEFFRKRYPNIRITGIDVKYFDDTGWHLYARGWKT